jgi:hypothetical protein
MQHEHTTTRSPRVRKLVLGATGLATAILFAAATLAVTHTPADARPNMVTPSKPCGSCHPPNKPPKR